MPQHPSDHCIDLTFPAIWLPMIGKLTSALVASAREAGEDAIQRVRDAVTS